MSVCIKSFLVKTTISGYQGSGLRRFMSAKDYYWTL